MSLTNDLLALLELPTWVPGGSVEPEAARIATLVEEGVVPLIEQRRPTEMRRHDHGEVAARFGPEGDDGLVLFAYVVAQHGDPSQDTPTVIGGESGLQVRGRGAAQCKGAFASALGALAELPELRRPVWLAVNTEGSSSHGGSRRLLEDLELRASAGIVLTGTDLAISRGNRGRVDVMIRIGGEACHSSQPSLGNNPFDRLPEVLERVRLAATPPQDPTLGPATVTPFAIRSEPVAPHTIPAALVVTVDRRLLPGESPDEAVASIRDALRGVDELEVGAGASMLPALVPEGSPIIEALAAGVAASGRTPAVVTSQNTFDAGHACSIGIPTPMFGPGRRRFGSDMVEPESVAVDDCERGTMALRKTIEQICC